MCIDSQTYGSIASILTNIEWWEMGKRKSVGVLRLRSPLLSRFSFLRFARRSLSSTESRDNFAVWERAYLISLAEMTHSVH